MIIIYKIIDENVLSEKQNWKLVNSNNFEPCDEFIYFTETLYKTSDGKYIMHTMWLINELWAEDEIKSGQMSLDELEPHEEYKIISEEQAQKWLEEMVDGKRYDINFKYMIRKEESGMMDFVFANETHREYFNEATIPEGMDFGAVEQENAAVIYLAAYAAIEEGISMSNVYDKNTQRVKIEALSEGKHSRRFEQILLLAYNLSTGCAEYDGKRLSNINEFFGFMLFDLPYIMQALSLRFPTLTDIPYEY